MFLIFKFHIHGFFYIKWNKVIQETKNENLSTQLDALWNLNQFWLKFRSEFLHLGPCIMYVLWIIKKLILVINALGLDILTSILYIVVLLRGGAINFLKVNHQRKPDDNRLPHRFKAKWDANKNTKIKMPYCELPHAAYSAGHVLNSHNFWFGLIINYNDMCGSKISQF